MAGLNWGVVCGLSGLFVFDIDPQGQAAWEALQAANPELREAVARSFTVRTPRGGFHHYFRGYGPTTASRIAEGIDTRGGYLDEATGRWKSLGFVVLPGSKTVAGPKTVDGEYTVIGGQLASMSPAVAGIVPERKKGAVHGLERSPDQDQPRNVQWARDLLENYVREGRVSVEGNGGNNVAFQVAASILDKAISPALTYELMDEMWNPHCSPPWDDWELERIVGNAAKYGEETGQGAKGFEDNQSAFAAFAGMETPPDDPKAERPKGRFKPMWLRDARKDVREASWLVPGFLPSRGTGILYGLSGSYKTFVALDWALSLAFGIAGQWGTPPVKHNVLFLAGESSYALAQERVDSWCEWQGVDPDAADFVIVRGVPAFNDKEGWEEVRDGLRGLNSIPQLVVVDTLTRVMSGMDENSNNDAKLVLKHMEEISEHYGCFTLSTGHTGKDEGRGMRGAQVFLDNSDAVIYAKKTGNGTKLQVKKLKEVDIPDQPFHMEKKVFGKSIVLVRTEQAAPEEQENGSKVSWAQTSEIVARIAKQGGSCGFKTLCQDIAAELHIDQKKIERTLNANKDLQWLREGNNWRLPPTDLEFDL